jgi:hypothetical protein
MQRVRSSRDPSAGRPFRTWGDQRTSHVEWREADAAGNRAARDDDVLSVLFSLQVLDGLCAIPLISIMLYPPLRLGYDA